MNKETALILALLGAGPVAATAAGQDGAAQQQEAYSVHARTANIVRELIASGAIYASPDATKLLIRRSGLSTEVIAGLERSNEVETTTAEGDFVLKPAFAIALLKGRAMDGMVPKSIQDYWALQQLQRQSSTDNSMELMSYHSAPFF